MRKNIFSMLMMAGALVIGTTALSSCGNEDNYWSEAINVWGDGLQGHEAYLEIGQTLQLKAENGFMIRGTGFEWESSDTSVATVTANGLITAVGPGTAVITVYTTGYPVINQNHVTIYVGNQTMGIGSGSVDQSNAE